MHYEIIDSNSAILFIDDVTSIYKIANLTLDKRVPGYSLDFENGLLILSCKDKNNEIIKIAVMPKSEGEGFFDPYVEPTTGDVQTLDVPKETKKLEVVFKDRKQKHKLLKGEVKKIQDEIKKFISDCAFLQEGGVPYLDWSVNIGEYKRQRGKRPSKIPLRIKERTEEENLERAEQPVKITFKELEDIKDVVEGNLGIEKTNINMDDIEFFDTREEIKEIYDNEKAILEKVKKVYPLVAGACAEFGEMALKKVNSVSKLLRQDFLLEKESLQYPNKIEYLDRLESIVLNLSMFYTKIIELRAKNPKGVTSKEEGIGVGLGVSNTAIGDISRSISKKIIEGDDVNIDDAVNKKLGKADAFGYLMNMELPQEFSVYKQELGKDMELGSYKEEVGEQLEENRQRNKLEKLLKERTKEEDKRKLIEQTEERKKKELEEDLLGFPIEEDEEEED